MSDQTPAPATLTGPPDLFDWTDGYVVVQCQVTLGERVFTARETARRKELERIPGYRASVEAHVRLSLGNLIVGELRPPIVVTDLRGELPPETLARTT